MATTSDLPCDGEGVCMICKVKPSESESIICNLCTATWHVPCLACPLESMASAVGWNCPDCSSPTLNATTINAVPSGVSSGLITSIKAIEADRSLSEREKAKKRQELVGGCGKVDEEDEGEEDEKKKKKNGRSDVLDLLDAKFNCSFCMQLPERPVTTPCGHNFCLKCFQKWTGQGKNTCVKCRASIPSKMASNPRINSALVVAIRMAKAAKLATSGSSNQIYHFIHNDNRPDKAFTTERAKKSGKANACSGQIFVTIPPDYLGPITAEYDPRRNQGVLVGETWEDRMECRQWGAHFPHVAGIAGQSDYGAQSVALSGGYEDDEDHGDWFLYTGSGGRDLSGNKRTNKEHAFDQKFEKLNEALRVSCLKGYPVRVVRSHKEKNSSYAPETGVRYDGVYRIEKCWRKVGRQGFKMCRYLFVRCDNEPAPWACDDHGDKPRPLPIIKELKHATDITERKGSPAWDFDEKNGWKWMKPPPLSKKPVAKQDLKDGVRVRKVIRHAHNTSVRGRLLKEFSCLICRKVMKFPLTTPCAHNFCKCCLLDSYADLSFVKERSRENGRTLRAQKVVNKCPCCPTDISEFLQNPQVNTDMMNLIESLEMEQEEKDVEETSVEASIESNDPEEATKSTQGTNVAKGLADGEKKIEEEFNVIEPNGEESDAAEDRKPSTSTKNCVQSSHCNLEEDGIAFRQPPITTTSPIPSAKNKHLCGEEMPTKKMKRDGKDTILDADHDKMVEAQNADSDVNATNFRQDEVIVTAGHSPNVQSDLLDSRKRKRPIATTVPQSGPGVRTRRIVAKTDVAASGRRTRSMSSNAISAHHSPIKCVAL